MNLLADEGVDASIVARLRSDGHDVTYIAESASGITDENVLTLAANDGRILVSDTIREHSNQMAGAFTVVSPGLVRIRH